MKSEEGQTLKEKLEELAEFSPIPVGELIYELTGFAVIPVEKSVIGKAPLTGIFKRLLKTILADLAQNPIIASKPNEAGNKIEPYVKRAIENDPNMTLLGKTKSSGYPDINASLNKTDERIYIECKTYSKRSKANRLRAFFVSPQLPASEFLC